MVWLTFFGFSAAKRLPELEPGKPEGAADCVDLFSLMSLWLLLAAETDMFPDKPHWFSLILRVYQHQ